ncbi:MAG TPA: hypothetical protein VHZ28_02275 [Terracidiphilus sp.]|jgi:hypothetical protein|nr:hypothetical protein [Terracidiphilus sp.]
MSHIHAMSAIEAACEQSNKMGGPEVQLWPHQTAEKERNASYWFVLGIASEGFRRQLTVYLSRGLEVNLPGEEYEHVCVPQIVSAILDFWNGAASEVACQVHIAATGNALIIAKPFDLSRELSG